MKIGILGGGQLGRMLALAGHNLAISTVCFDESPEAVAADVTTLHVDNFEHPRQLAEFLRGLDVVTYEFENVPVSLARAVAQTGVPVHPAPLALQTCQDRWLEKQCFSDLGIATAPFFRCTDRLDFTRQRDTLGSAIVLKSRRGGYDGKGQWVLGPSDPWPDAADRCCTTVTGGLLAEQRIPFSRELSQVSVRDIRGNTLHYPLTENTHRHGILHTSIAPAPGITTAVIEQATAATEAVMAKLDYVGVHAIEFFQVGDRLIANEMAPRVHNSGHWTMDACITGQFENHLRAVAGLPLGSVDLRQPFAAMINIIGAMPDKAAILGEPSFKLHDYGKAPRPGRKLGHINITAGSAAERDHLLAKAAAIVGV